MSVPVSSDSAPGDAGTAPNPPGICGVVVHWHAERDLEQLRAAWPEDPRFDLVVVDNGSTAMSECDKGRIYRPPVNLGFAGAINWASHHCQARWLLILNPDVRPHVDALAELLSATEQLPEAAGIVPALFSEDGDSQSDWQLRRLPEPWHLVAQTLFINCDLAIDPEPAPGDAIAQPAAAVLLLSRERLLELDGFDQRFFPAWFEDVDFCRRVAARNLALRYWPTARFSHRLGGTVARLGYGPFLWIYYRNLDRYLAKHHGRGWRTLARLLLPLGILARLAALPLRRPRRVTSRWGAARGLVTALGGSLSGWRWPKALASAWSADREVTT